jgi:hypothetical protein
MLGVFRNEPIIPNLVRLEDIKSDIVSTSTRKASAEASTGFFPSYSLAGLIPYTIQTPTIQLVNSENRKAQIFQFINNSARGGVCQGLLEDMAADDLGLFLDAIKFQVFSPAFLSFAAEMLGDLLSLEQAHLYLAPLLHHQEPIVREGAIYGYEPFIADSRIRKTIERIAQTDSSAGVRQAAKGILEE